MDTFSTAADMWPDLFQGQSFPELLTSSSLAARKSTNYGICDGKVAKAEAGAAAEERRAVTNLTTTLRYEVCSCARALVYLCAVSQQNANGSAGVTEGRKGKITVIIR